MADWYEYQFNDDPKCPHCDQVAALGFEIEFGTGQTVEIDCQHCEKPVVVREDTRVTYSTQVPKVEQGDES